ncbi:MAG TPA: tetratricopeptide repeat protein [Nannocystaceae bacterium]|nr:tetratricopeptide repeat protein [Nannocystaceae bacterium]
MGTTRTWCAAFVAAALLAAGAPSVHARGKPSAADVKRAEELYDNGRKLFGEGSFEAAALAFEQAWELSGNADMLYNAAIAYDRADAFDQAISALDRYRALAPADERDALDERKRSLQARRDQRHARADIAGGEPTGDAAVRAGDDAPYPSGSPAERTRLFGPAAWALGGTALAVLALGTGFGAASLVRSRDGRDHCDGGDPPLCETGARGDAKLAESYAIVADVSFAVGGALTIALVTVLAVKARRRAGKTSRRDHARRRATKAAFEPHTRGMLVRF